MEDLGLKHNSAVKQMMREFNTQMALKDTEIDSAVKETIGKAGKSSVLINLFLRSANVNKILPSFAGAGWYNCMETPYFL